MADESGEKTEEPTQKKLDDARKRGQVWKSRDLTGALVFFVGYAMLTAGASQVYLRFHMLFDGAMDTIAHLGTPEHDTNEALMNGLVSLLVLCLPVVAGAAIVGGLADFLQVGPLFTGDPVMPKLEKLNPMDGLKNIFSKKTVVEALKNMLKVSLAGYLAWTVLRDHVPVVIQTVHTTPLGLVIVLGELVYRLTIKVGLLLVLIALFDVWWQHRTYMKDMMMTREEVKREYKESEGDPHHKAKRKELHQEILEHSAIESVQNADVVITNPTHVAVAISYDKEKDASPRVLAKGVDELAARIRELAKKHDVPMVRNVPLAHALNRLDLGTEIPEELYDAVAEVLNFVYGLQNEQAPSMEPRR
ncbi:MAG: type III secretion system export apparatus subunit SctU [Deltaproteobacteria bacterium]|nr:type III secretion system export apparatus subunit SctU [Deltaproteobacteria bacterium]